MPANMNELLANTAVATSQFLGSKLPSLTEGDWWGRLVMPFLSDGQRNAVDRHNITQLSELDLAALLNTLDSNWLNLDEICQFPMGSRSFVREMRTMRNRWSHMPAAPERVADDIYRDLDTLERFLSVIEADNDLLETVRAERLAVVGEIVKAHSLNIPEQIRPTEEPAAQVGPSEKPASPSCPVCESTMVLRTARTGPYAGNQFWGCSEWSVTGCNGIVNVPKQQDTETEQPPACPDCQSIMVLRTARAGPYAGRPFWGCSEWGITGCSGLLNIPEERIFDPNASDADDLPF